MIVLNLWQLYRNAAGYQLAGNIVRLTTAEISKADSGKTIAIENLPQSQNGALIFRNGLIDALQFFGVKNKPVTIVSVKDEKAGFEKSLYRAVF